MFGHGCIPGVPFQSSFRATGTPGPTGGWSNLSPRPLPFPPIPPPEIDLPPLSAAVRTVVSFLILAGGVLAFQKLSPPDAPEAPPKRVVLPVVDVVSAQPHGGGVTFSIDGTVVPYRSIQLASEVAGRVQFKSDDCRVGRRVSEGELLVRIDPRNYELEVRRLEQEVASAEAQLKELDSQLKTSANQVRSLKRQLDIDTRKRTRLSDMQGRNAASIDEVETAQRTEVVSRNSLQQIIDQIEVQQTSRARLTAQVELAKANLDVARLSLERTEIRSPIDAIVAEDLIEQDGYVQSGATMLTLQDTSRVDVSCKLMDEQMNLLWAAGASDDTAIDAAPASDRAFPVTPARVRYDVGGTTYQWSGTLDRFDGAGMDSVTRMVPCRVHVDEPRGSRSVDESAMTLTSNVDGPNEQPTDAPEAGESMAEGESMADGLAPPPPRKLELLTGMFVDVLIDADVALEMVRLPQRVVQPGKRVWVVRGGELLSLPIEVVSSTGDDLLVRSGPDTIRDDDAIVSSPVPGAADGTEVILRGSPEEAAQIAAGKKAAKGRRWGR